METRASGRSAASLSRRRARALLKGFEMDIHNRRRFLGGAAAVAASLSVPLRAFAATSPFKVGVISDEISQDFDHACYVLAKEWNLGFVELREVWGKNL